MPSKKISDSGRELKAMRYCRIQKIAFGFVCVSLFVGVLFYSAYPFIALIGFLLAMAFLSLYLFFRGLTIFVYPESGLLFFNDVEELKKGSEKTEAMLGWIIPGVVLFVLFACAAVYVVLAR